MLALNVCKPDHVGTMAWLKAGAASDRMNVAADPFTTARPTEAVGFAATGSVWSPVFVPPTVALADNVSVCVLSVNAPPLIVSPALNVCSPLHVGTMAWLKAGAASDRMNVTAVPLTVVSPIDADGLAPLGIADIAVALI